MLVLYCRQHEAVRGKANRVGSSKSKEMGVWKTQSDFFLETANLCSKL